MKTNTDTLHGVPESFLARFGEHCSGILSGFDRMRFMGRLRTLQDARGMAGYLHRAGVLLKGFADYAEKLSERVREHARRASPGCSGCCARTGSLTRSAGRIVTKSVSKAGRSSPRCRRRAGPASKNSRKSPREIRARKREADR